MSCYICLEDLNSPVSLPCGHVFCSDCLKRAVQAVQAYSTLHACPTCRHQYHLLPLDPSTIPPHLRPHLTPSIRKVYLDLPPSESIKSGSSASEPSSSASTEIARLRAENDALRHNCMMWRRRAEVHSKATLGLLELSRVARDQALHIARQRDTIHQDYFRLNHDFQRQQAILSALVTAMPPQELGSLCAPHPLSVPDQSRAVPVKTEQPAPPLISAQSSRSTGSGHLRKRLRTVDDENQEPPAKRRIGADRSSESDARDTGVQVKTET